MAAEHDRNLGMDEYAQTGACAAGIGFPTAEPDDAARTDAPDDATFAELFSALDDVTASPALREAALASIFAQMEMTADVQADDNPHEANVPHADAPSARIVRPEAFSDASRSTASRPASRSRTLRFTLRRLVAAVAIVAVLTVGGTAYATPSADVTIGTADAPIVLHVNRFNIVISAEAETPKAQEILKEAPVNHRGYEESLERLMDAYERAYGDDLHWTIDADSSGIGTQAGSPATQGDAPDAGDPNADGAADPSGAPSPDASNGQDGRSEGDEPSGGPDAGRDGADFGLSVLSDDQSQREDLDRRGMQVMQKRF